MFDADNTRMIGLPYGEKKTITIMFSLFIQYRNVTDGRTDRIPVMWCRDASPSMVDIDKIFNYIILYYYRNQGRRLLHFEQTHELSLLTVSDVFTVNKDNDQDQELGAKDFTLKDQDLSTRTRTWANVVTSVWTCQAFKLMQKTWKKYIDELTTANYGRCQVSKISHVMCVWKQVSQKTTL